MPMDKLEQFPADATELQEFLEAHGALLFEPGPGGLFPASHLSEEVGQATGMNMGWLRDNAHVAMALYDAGSPEQKQQAIDVGNAMLTVLTNNRGKLDGIVTGALRTDDRSNRLPIRFDLDTLENDREHRVQNDSFGYALWLVGRLIKDGAITADIAQLDTLAQTVRYLDKIEYWHDADEGHWEEDTKIHVSSIGACVAGLRMIRQAFETVGYDDVTDIGFDGLINRGEQAVHTMLLRKITERNPIGGSVRPLFRPGVEAMKYAKQTVTERVNNGRLAKILKMPQPPEQLPVRRYDAALLFLVEPLQMLKGREADIFVRRIAEQLERDEGVARYVGDTYWAPRFPHIMSIEERTHAAKGRLDMRNRLAPGVAHSMTEARWTLFDPVLSSYWGRRYLQTGVSEYRDLQQKYLRRSLLQLSAQPDGRYLIPEAYYLEEIDGENRWIPNDHTPLLWSQANLLRALHVNQAIAASGRST